MSEKTSRTKHTFRQLSHFVKPYRGVFIAVALFAVLSSIFSTAQPYLIKVAIVLRQKQYCFKSECALLNRNLPKNISSDIELAIG